MAETIKIGGELESTATGNKVADVANIKDKTKGDKSQAEINAEIDAAIQTETERAITAENNRYTKAETYNKSELNNMITTPNQQYVSVTATVQTTSVTYVLPATGAANTVYRVGNWDGSQFDASVYSEYAWNGNSYVHLSTKTKIGEVFDISAYHATGGTLATYADLSAALDFNNGGGVPQSLQEGGMSIKFVQSSDNKYVQYRLMADEFTTDVTKWQGVDDKPTPGSKNLVESGGVYNSIKGDTQELVESNVFIGQNINYENGKTGFLSGYLLNKEPINIGGNASIKWKYANIKDLSCQLVFLDSSKGFISGFTGNQNSGIRSINVPSGAVYVNAVFASNCYDAGIYDSNDVPIFSVSKGSVQEQFDNIKSILTHREYLFKTELSGHLYPIKGIPLQKGEPICFSLKASGTISGTQLTLKIANPDGTTYQNIEEKIVYANDSKTWDGSELTYIFTPTENKDNMMIGHYINNITKDVDVMIDIVRMRWSNNNSIAYITNTKYPSFSFSGSAVTITLPANENIRLYDKQGGVIREVNIGSNNVFQITTLRQLVVDLNDNTLKVIQLSKAGNYVSLLSNVSTALDGALASYYVKTFEDFRKEISTKIISDQYTDAVKLLGNVYVNVSTGVITEGTMNRGIFYFPVKAGDIVHYITKTTDGSTINNACVAVTSDAVPTVGSPVLEFKAWSRSTSIDEFYKVQNDGTLYYYIYKTDVQVFSCNKVSSTFVQTVPNAGSIVEYWNTPDKIVTRDNVLNNSDLNILFFSDIHGRDDELRRIVELGNHWNDVADFIIDGGDDTRSYMSSTPIASWYDSIASNSQLPIIRAVGNHDAWSTGTWTWATPQQIYEYLTLPAVTLLRTKGATVVQPSDAATEYRNYYYVDFNNIRIIVLLSLNFHGSDPYYDSDENTWFTNVLNDARSNNKHVLCINHGPLPPDNCIEIKSNWTSFKSWKQLTDNQHINPDAVETIDDFITNGGDFICWLTGHTHADYLLKTENTVNTQFCFTTSCARGLVLDGNQPQYRTSFGYDLFNMIGIDLTNSLIKLWRIGFNTNGALQSHTTLCYDYHNHEIISEN